MRDISYEQQTVNSTNPLARFAHRSRMELALTLTNCLCPADATVVEFGSGPGHFLHNFGEMRPDVRLVGYDPYMSPLHPEIRYAESMRTLDDASVDILATFEVCEHLYPHEIDELLADATRILKPDGTLIISVPIMYGLAVFPKVLNWMWRH